MKIVEKAENFVFHLFKDRLSPHYIYHNFNHTLRVVNAAAAIGQGEGVSEDEAEELALAAWFHDTGYIEGPDNHERRSSKIALDFLKEHNYPEDKARIISHLILATELRAEPKNTLEAVIKDADCAHFADHNYIQLSELLREEWKITGFNTFTDLEWAVGNRLMLLHKHRYYTAYAKKVLQPLKDANIAALQEAINTCSSDSKKKEKKKKKKEEDAKKAEKPERGIDTMFRVTLGNHTRLSDIADSKANILLSVNTIIISIALSSLIPKLDSPANAHLIMPTFIMMLFSTVSIVFAILSTRPKVNTSTFTKEDVANRKVNLLFFGNFHKMSLEDYDAAIKEMMMDRDYVYGSLVKDLYYLGLVLDRKYKLLRITYNIFMTGIIVSVSSFVYAFWML
ncbi:Pycsar system effector family protein [Flavobacterium psychrotrophum]|uniref:Pycsar system effector family protein n=1 Tax=Flavobacterium psychrotrophum TaxID=2294119 RepID=UPI000E317345|nr:Pycsar system effector family protein [Flavobacterium psychrotrophum]